MPICYIFAAGDAPEALPFRPGEGDFVIAADAGYRTCLTLGITPDLLVGDFDSMEAPADFPHILRAPVEKDDTDTLLAVKEGLRRGYAVFHLYGGAGGRLDHTLANLQALGFLAAHDAVGFLFEAQQTLTWLQDGSARFAPQPEGLLSVFAPGGPARGVDLCGLQYPLQGATLSPTVPLGVSNHFTGQAATVTVRHGALLLAWDRPCLPQVDQGTAQPPARCPNTDPGRDSR